MDSTTVSFSQIAGRSSSLASAELSLLPRFLQLLAQFRRHSVVIASKNGGADSCFYRFETAPERDRLLDGAAVAQRPSRMPP